LKPKPMMMFMNLLFQKQVIPRPKESTEYGVYTPRKLDEDYNHPK
jgi:hypothetical protein